MAKLTTAQKLLIKKIKKSNNVYFKRRLNSDKNEQCFVGKNRVNSRVFFFLFNIGFISVTNNYVFKEWDFYIMRIVQYKLDEYLEDYKTPYVIPE